MVLETHPGILSMGCRIRSFVLSSGPGRKGTLLLDYCQTQTAHHIQPMIRRIAKRFQHEDTRDDQQSVLYTALEWSRRARETERNAPPG